MERERVICSLLHPCRWGPDTLKQVLVHDNLCTLPVEAICALLFSPYCVLTLNRNMPTNNIKQQKCIKEHIKLL